MLSDPLFIAMIDSASFAEVYSNGISGSATSVSPKLRLKSFSPGSTVREGKTSGAYPLSLTISHSKTKENPPFGTDRTLIRLDWRKPTSTGVVQTLSAYCVVAAPSGGDAFNATGSDAVMLAKSLAFIILAGDRGEAGGVDDVTAPDLIQRVLAGEP
jgi:hypothetical protein